MKPIRNWYDVSSEDPHEIIGRYVNNALGVREIVMMPRISWAYLDWLEEGGAQIAEHIKACDRKRGDIEFGDCLQTWTYWALQDRDRAGLPRPAWLLDFEMDVSL
jgi:hypothetical protein